MPVDIRYSTEYRQTESGIKYPLEYRWGEHFFHYDP